MSGSSCVVTGASPCAGIHDGSSRAAAFALAFAVFLQVLCGAAAVALHDVAIPVCGVLAPAKAFAGTGEFASFSFSFEVSPYLVGSVEETAPFSLASAATELVEGFPEVASERTHWPACEASPNTLGAAVSAVQAVVGFILVHLAGVRGVKGFCTVVRGRCGFAVIHFA